MNDMLGDPPDVKYDEIGEWSKVKLDILQDYAKAYSTILTKKIWAYHIYVDAFAGWGKCKLRETGEIVDGSALVALSINPPFREYHFIDLESERVDQLTELSGNNPNVYIYEGDCNKVLLDNIIPMLESNRRMRALCLLDPYGLHYDWEVVQRLGKAKAVDLFLNFQISDAQRNALWRDPGSLPPDYIARMDLAWGDKSWRDMFYEPEETLFEVREKKIAKTEDVIEAYRRRLREIAGFARVPKPISMRTKAGAVIYYLYFASKEKVAEDIIKDVFDKYRKDRG